MEKILVLGSINIDFVSFMSRYPRPGETLVSNDFVIFQGGKGANQAIALAKLEVPTTMLGKVGKDPLKDLVLSSLTDSGVNISGISLSPKKPSGSASIWVNEKGQNSIAIFPGANEEVDKNFVINNEKLFQDATYFLAQFEVPIESVFVALKIAKKNGLKTLIDPAPGRDINENKFWPLIDYILPNEIELKELTHKDNLLDGIHFLKAKGIKEVIVKLGEKGAIYERDNKLIILPPIAPDNTVVDTTGAGDCFAAGFISGLMQGKEIGKAIMMGNLVASYSIQKKGAAISFPKKSEVDWAKLNEQNYDL